MQDFEKLGVFYLGRELDAARDQPTGALAWTAWRTGADGFPAAAC
ncbi:MAG TPA: hypothetical protein VE046_14085 [Steroidobacteraceae bacterium]|nr:hypothetical protein [Steroidobacteraceae bacterium]